ncbi:MAG TPA: ABC transporter permease [Anaerolineaceae bacterium]|nr:ABC transporter permease [Anaerolineaceae bacterium]HPN51595.1 ABC transporter permease [Anaerolineaceae bacterium]
MKKVMAVFRFELIKTLTNVWFIISALLLPALGILFSILITSAEYKTPAAEIINQAITPDAISTDTVFQQGYVDQVGVIKVLPEGSEGLHAFADLPAAMAALDVGDINAVYLIPENFYVSTTVYVSRKDFNPLGGFFEGDQFRDALAFNLKGANQPVWNLMKKPLERLQITTLSAASKPAMKATAAMFKNLLPFMMMIFMFMMIITTSTFFLNSLAGEQNSRLLEMAMTSINLRSLLLGKILAMGLVGFILQGFWLVCGSLFSRDNPFILDVTQDLNLSWSFVLWVAIFFVLGYILYGAALAGIGATTSFVLESSYYDALFSIIAIFVMIRLWPITQNPDSTTAVILSFIPPLTPMIMIMRLAISEVPLWQLVVSVILMAAAIWLTISVSARLIRGEVLFSAQKFLLKPILKALLMRK